MTTTEVAESLGLGRRATYNRLDRLVEQGVLETKKVGANARVWWRPPTDGRPDERQSFVPVSPVEGSLTEVDVEPVSPSPDQAYERSTGGAPATDGSTRDAGNSVTKTASTGGESDRKLEDGGSAAWVDVAVAAVHDDEEPPEGYLNVSRDGADGSHAGVRDGDGDDHDVVEHVLETSPVGVTVLDEEGTPTRMNARAREMFGVSGEGSGLTLPPALTVGEGEGATHSGSERDHPVVRALAAGESTFDWETEVEGPDGNRRWLSVNVAPLTDDDGGVERVVLTSEDVTGLHERTRQLERQRDELKAQLDTAFARVSDGFFELDADLRFTSMNDRAGELLGLDAEAVVGREVVEEPSLPESLTVALQRAADNREVVTVEDHSVPLEAWLEYTVYPTDTGLSVYCRDVTERKEHERERQLRERLNDRELPGLGGHTLKDLHLDTMLAETTELLADTLDCDYCQVLELDGETDTLTLRAGVGWDESLVGSATVSATGDDVQTAYTLGTADPVVVGDLERETRFGPCELLADHGVRSGISTVIGPAEDPWGILGVHDTEPRHFLDRDTKFVQAIADILSSAIARRVAERELHHQRRQLGIINDLYEVIAEINVSTIEQSTSAEIRRVVCEQLAATDLYQFAWIGEVDAISETVTLQTEAGVEDYLDGITISIAEDDARSEGPTGRAFQTGEMQTAQCVDTGTSHDAWPGLTDEYEFRSSAAVPLVHEGSVYGVLNIYSGRPHAFGGRERELVANLGEIVGHAIAAAERKQALVSDEVVELGFRIRNAVAPVEMEGAIRFEHAISTGGGKFLVYGRATEDAVDTVHELVETFDHWERVRFYSEDDPGHFEVRLVDPPVLSKIASFGGHIEEAVIEDGNLQATVHFASTVDVRQVVDSIEEVVPRVEMLRRRQLNRTYEDPRRSLVDDLTDRQRTTLEAAYRAGFFEWPREASGEDVAESMEVSAPTFHQHLRKAERKVFDALLSPPAP